ncbi:MAG TPA: methyltransferase domain-containing protein [Myxococcota bacterium]|nr:methyltransferase domain-containing protein [Myxococcota bacterium]
MNDATYYRDHWLEIEPQRLEAYEQMFEWRPQNAPLLEPAQLAAGQVVVDYGCGPGGLAVELARRVAPGGRVHGVDLNAAFLERAAARARREGVESLLSFHRTEGEKLPLESRFADRLVCKNVMEYVPDVAATLSEFRRVLRPGGLAHVIDSDWGLLAVEPLGAERMAELFAAAAPAYRTPHIGRKLYGAMRAAGFSDVKLKIVATADTKGFTAAIVFNMLSYARESGRLSAATLESLQADLKRSLADGSFLLILPQFLVTGSA